MLKTLHIQGLHGDPKNNIDIDFNDDLTILSGRNGSGKTTILEFLWYAISPNIERIFDGFRFSEAKVVTDVYELELANDSKTRFARFVSKGLELSTQSELEDENKRTSRITRALGLPSFDYRLEEINIAIKNIDTSSLFFPTFRRFEKAVRNRNTLTREFANLAQVIAEISQNISVDNHRYVASVSTRDIKELITSKYASASEQALRLREQLLEKISNEIRCSDAADQESAREQLEKFADMIRQSNEEQKEVMTSFNALRDLVGRFMEGKSVKITGGMSIGGEGGVREVGNAIDSDCLSAGEKQMLGFFAYNAFYDKAVVIIDEPELSLHVDWQRELVPALLGQETDNQFILATHSPFIYSRYPEKEVLVGQERGCSHG